LGSDVLAGGPASDTYHFNPNFSSDRIFGYWCGKGDSPTIAGGRVTLLLHLLSPARRPIQVTSDLPGFWRGSYREVKKELKGRYPKHHWPDDPLTAEATRGVKRQPRSAEK
jgi:ATP-dependent helicase HrpB